MTAIVCRYDRRLQSLADPELQKRGGQIFSEICERPFLGVSRKNFSISPKSVHLSLKISDDLFLVIDLFNVFQCGIFHRGAKSVADIGMAGQNPYFSTYSQFISLLFLPPRGAKLHCQLRWGGHGRICPPWISH